MLDNHGFLNIKDCTTTKTEINSTSWRKPQWPTPFLFIWSRMMDEPMPFILTSPPLPTKSGWRVRRGLSSSWLIPSATRSADPTPWPNSWPNTALRKSVASSWSTIFSWNSLENEPRQARRHIPKGAATMEPLLF